MKRPEAWNNRAFTPPAAACYIKKAWVQDTHTTEKWVINNNSHQFYVMSRAPENCIVKCDRRLPSNLKRLGGQLHSKWGAQNKILLKISHGWTSMLWQLDHDLGQSWLKLKGPTWKKQQKRMQKHILARWWRRINWRWVKSDQKSDSSNVTTSHIRSTMSATISLDEEVRLYSTNAEREKYSTLATLFGIIISLDYLERAYVRDSITAAEWVSL